MESTASGYAAELAGLTGQAWSGPSSLLMTAAVTGRSAVRAADLDDDYLDGRIGHPRNGFQ
ncbi:hypothetical protein [Mycobacterium mantenii]|uniref:hypothetical protein n=1 Tax=Mycobacterium mantenii TaxID=560555 RepID=UPI0009F6981A